MRNVQTNDFKFSFMCSINLILSPQTDARIENQATLAQGVAYYIAL